MTDLWIWIWSAITLVFHCGIIFNFLTSYTCTVGVDPKQNMKDVFAKFSLDVNTQEFTGHAVALYRDDE